MVLKNNGFSYILNDFPEVYLTIEEAAREEFDIFKYSEEKTEDFYEQLKNDDYLGTSD